MQKHMATESQTPRAKPCRAVTTIVTFNFIADISIDTNPIVLTAIQNSAKMSFLLLLNHTVAAKPLYAGFNRLTRRPNNTVIRCSLHAHQ